MKKFFLSVAVILGFGLYAFGLSRQGKGNQPIANPPVTSANNNTTTAPTTDPLPTPSARTSPPSTTTPTYRNGTFTSSVEDAFYGNVQIRTTIKAGRITDLQFLQYPNDRGHSIEINNYAMPILRQEAISAQSAQVDIVSGATATSQAFQLSLANALAQAQS